MSFQKIYLCYKKFVIIICKIFRAAEFKLLTQPLEEYDRNRERLGEREKAK